MPSRFREIGVALGASVVVPLWIAAPLLVVTLLVAVLTASALVWAIVWVVLGLTVLSVAVLVLALTVTTSTTMVRWIEFRPAGRATQIVVARFLRSSTVAVADLQRVVVVERLRLGRRKSIRVVLQTPHGATVDCEPALHAPLSQVGTEALLDWLAGQLGSTQAVMEHRTEVDRDFQCPDEWWTPSDLSALWHVPVSAVDQLAVRHGIRSYQYTPRGAATHRDGTKTVYDPARAHEVAEELREAHAVDLGGNGTKEVPQG
ncbi:hypothetical protein [Streptomyces sp. DSM 15324]|uniref:hypothetical protein n=1 Tax=Streptomyces sp. DSM 15324 TaxID=1739111 RepID=UPI000745FC43|nr:hypothetical protein [Streptomyces sp. DSM 15324]KUO09437.1 hypothetical protein AQJ58_25980 [Streptomyces sp. DSM 15324]